MFDIIEENFGFMLLKGDRPVYSVRVLVEGASISRCRQSPIPVWFAGLTFKNDWLVDIGSSRVVIDGDVVSDVMTLHTVQV